MNRRGSQLSQDTLSGQEAGGRDSGSHKTPEVLGPQGPHCVRQRKAPGRLMPLSAPPLASSAGWGAGVAGAGGAPTRHQEVSGLVVRVSVGDGLRQVVDGHLILLVRLHHKVAEGKTPLGGGRKERVKQVMALTPLSPKITPLAPQRSVKVRRKRPQPPYPTSEGSASVLCFLWSLLPILKHSDWPHQRRWGPRLRGQKSPPPPTPYSPLQLQRQGVEPKGQPKAAHCESASLKGKARGLWRMFWSMKWGGGL